MIQFELNGEAHSVPPGASIADLARAIALDPARIAVERNREIVPRSTLHQVLIAPGDKIEIVHFVGGGQ
jgi:thiazole synthase